MSDIQTFPGELAAQISRVTEIREQYCEAAKIAGSQANFIPSIMMMTRSLDAAIQAANSPDIEGQIRAVRDLREYSA